MLSSSPTWSDRAWVRCRRGWIDNQLARGAPADGTPALALRAHQLTSLRERRAIAAGLDAILVAAAEAQLDPASRLVLDHMAVNQARPEIIVLIQRLRHDRTLEVRGLALSRLLTFGPRSPLLRSTADATLTQAMAEIRDAL